MEIIFDAQQAKELDDYTINECGLMPEVLMERAALKVADAITEREDNNSLVLVVCGSGNNGADGICIARILKDRGFKVMLSLVGNEEKATPLYKAHKMVALKWGIEYYNIIPNDEYDVIVDALFGIGLSRDISGKYHDTIEKINFYKNNAISLNKRCTVYSVDMPSGINATTGMVMGTAIKADITVTFGYRKTGQMLYPGLEFCGKIICEEIGFSSPQNACIYSNIFTYNKNDLKYILPNRRPDSNKGDYGKVLIIAGSKNMAGAAVLCAKAAINSGAGLVKVFTCQSNRIIIQTAVPEALLCTFRDDWILDSKDVEEFKSAFIRELSWADMVVIGPGISTSDSSVKMIEYLCKYITSPVVLDADALNIISENENIAIPKNSIITPHIKEMSRLCKLSVSSIKENIIETACSYAEKNNTIVVLKDSKTVVSDGKKVYINSSGNDGLSTGGSGDVLAGIIASFVAQGLNLSQGAMTGVYVHGLAADYYSKEHSSFSLTPTLLIEQLGYICHGG